MRSGFRWLLGNLSLILLSLALSLLVWAVAVEQENPTSERRYSAPIPLTLSGVPEEMVAYGQTDAQVYVTLRAPESVWSNLRPEDLHATADLSGMEQGMHRVNVQVRVDQRPVQVRRVEPESVIIHLEPISRTVVPVSVRIEGNAALGFIARPAVVSILRTTASGPESLVARVAEAVAYVSVEGGRADVDGQFGLEARDGEGNVVPYVSLSPDRVVVHVPVEQLSGFRDLAVTAVLRGQVAPGYRISSVTVSPPLVTVYGAPEVIAQIPGYLETAPVDLEGAQKDVEVRLPLQAPEGVSLLMQEPVVTVRVAVVALEGSLTVRRDIEIQGLSPGLTATVAPTVVELILSGPLPVLDQLQEEDVRVIVDLFGLGPGRHSVTPRVVVVPTEVIAESFLPASAQVEIAPALTVTPGR